MKTALFCSVLFLAACTAPPPAEHAHLLDPSHPDLNHRAPDDFRVKFITSKGSFLVQVRRAWSPRGADRFYNLVRNGFYDGVRFFRVIENWVAQLGISGNPAVSAAWSDARIVDDAVRRSNVRGTMAFATDGPHTRTTQIYVNFQDNSRLDRRGFSPFGEVVEGMQVVDSLYRGYGEGQPKGRGPLQDRIENEGNHYLINEFPNLDYVILARILPERL